MNDIKLLLDDLPRIENCDHIATARNFLTSPDKMVTT